MLRYLKILEWLEVEIWCLEGVGVVSVVDVKGWVYVDGNGRESVNDMRRWDMY